MMKGHNQCFNVCWDITSRCNENCLFCYRNSDTELTLDENLQIFKNLVDNYAMKISFTGGEPLLYRPLFELAKAGKEYCSQVKLSVTTNGLLLAKWDDEKNCFVPELEALEKIASYFEWIALPLDAPNAAMQTEITRNAQHYARILFLIDFINTKYPKLKIKINTLISKINAHAIPELFALLKGKEIKRWKLFDFMPSRGSALIHKDRFYIPEEIFNHVCKSIDTSKKPSMKVTFNSYQDFTNSYFYISSSGFLIKFDGKNYEKLVDCRCRKALDAYIVRQDEDIPTESGTLVL